MRTNKQKEIMVPKSGFKRSRFNWSHDVNTTFAWGEVQPTVCKLLIPDSKTTMQAQSLIRLAPMVAPTFGRVKYKTYSQFVALGDIFPNFDAMMAQEPVVTAAGKKVPAALPSVSAGLLSSWVLHGARCTLWYVDPDAPDPAAEQAAGHYRTEYKTRNLDGSWSIPAEIGGIINGIVTAGVIASSADPYQSAANGVMPNVGARQCLALGAVNSALAGVFTASNHSVILGAVSSGDLVPAKRDYAPSITNGFRELEDYQREVSLESADYVIEGSYVAGGDTYYYALAFELSDFGKRIRKVIQGCGYQINFTGGYSVSLLPLLAQFKAYFDVFGLQLYQGWETTFCSQLIKYVENNFVTYIAAADLQQGGLSSIDNSNVFNAFMVLELGNQYYTEEADFIGAHLDKLAVSPNYDTGSFFSVNGNLQELMYGAHVHDAQTIAADGVGSSQDPLSASSAVGNTDDDNLGAYPFINAINHGEVDAMLLMRMYKVVNRSSILGRAIEKRLRAEGHGKYVDQCKSYFIGNTDTLIGISDVVSTAATEEAVLGEYGGRGLQYDSSRTFAFENDCYGYWITLATIVPESGYTQGIDPTLTSLKKMDLYNADFDAIGMELTRKSVVVGSKYLTQLTGDGGLNAGFGFIPRYSKFKVFKNLVNGDFNRHGKRNVYLPYTLDKQLNVNDFDIGAEVYDEVGGVTFCSAELRRSVDTTKLPIAGNWARTPTKFAWLGNFNRIFFNVGLRDDASLNTSLTQLVGFSDYNDDNFLSHSIVSLMSYAPMKPIEESYGLEEPNPEHGGVTYTKKA